MNRIIRYLQKKTQSHPYWLGFTAFVVGNVACNLLSSLIYEFSTQSQRGAWGWGVYAFWFLITIVALVASGLIGSSLLTFLVYPVSTHQGAKPRRVLVCFLSRAEPNPVYKDEPRIDAPLSNDLGEDLRMLAESQEPKLIESRWRETKPWSWSQVLRMLAFQNGLGSHAGSKLDVVAFVCSPESLSLSPALVAHVRRYSEFGNIKIFRLLKNENGPHKLVPEEHTEWDAQRNGWDFNSYHDLEDCLRSLLASVKGLGYSDFDVVIDITGGTKITSIAASTVTIGTPIVAQYVSTNPRVTTSGDRIFDVFEYDLGVRKVHQGS